MKILCQERYDKAIAYAKEIKYCKDPDDLYETADDALSQIQEKRYCEYFDKLRCSRKLAYGIAFCCKDCAVSVGQLPDKSSQERKH